MVNLSWAQEGVIRYNIQGQVTDSLSNEPLGYVSINVNTMDKPNQPVVASVYTDEQGYYHIPNLLPGKYQLESSFVGYRSKAVPFVISKNGPTAVLPIIAMSPDVNLLGEVTVTARKKLVEQQPGMLIYHAENDPSNTGGSAADVLRKAPALNVDADGNLTMRGNGNIRILINGKYNGQVARSPADALNMIPSDIIQSVEIVTSPNAKYDAEGAAGVINIITKKNSQSFGGALALTGGNWEQVLNPRADFSSGKWNINTYAHLHRLQIKEERQLDRLPDAAGETGSSLSQFNTGNNVKPHGALDLSVDYQADTSTLINFSAAGWLGNWPVNTLQDNTNMLNGTSSYYQQEVHTRRAPNAGFELNSSYTKRFRRPRQEFFAIVQYVNNLKDDYDYDTWHRNKEGNIIYQEQNLNHMQTVEWTLQSDYSHPLSSTNKSELELGIKSIFRDVVSGYSTLASEDDPNQLLPQPSRTDQFDYSQNVLAAYLQAKLDLRAGWFAIGGMRLEKTFIEGRFRSVAAPFKNDYTNWVPSATFEKKWNNNGTLAASYTQRISRPSIIDLNPNIDARDANNLVVGNPDLRPQASHQTELSYSANTPSGVFLFGSLFWSQMDNSIEDVVHIDPVSGVSTTTKQNLGASKQYGMNFSTTWPVSEKWSLSANANTGYRRFRSGALDIASQGWAWGLNMNLNYSAGNHYSFQAFGDYDSRAITLQGHESHWFYYSFSAKKELPKQNLTLTFITSNPFSSYTSRIDVFRASGYASTFNTHYYNQSFKLTLGWKFGQNGRQLQHKTVENDDVNSSREK
ncbi:outer membrane beta-barrel family protein [Olivibacter ginsenosidimutans]|uniref:Outer membrane beta-barrel family protein n=1 Tax=Olivibacter ginsenosidimutans TaxID=1176537 RepID=A0ABP9CE72_9SPHI